MRFTAGVTSVQLECRPTQSQRRYCHHFIVARTLTLIFAQVILLSRPPKYEGFKSAPFECPISSGKSEASVTARVQRRTYGGTIVNRPMSTAIVVIALISSHLRGQGGVCLCHTSSLPAYIICVKQGKGV